RYFVIRVALPEYAIIQPGICTIDGRRSVVGFIFIDQILCGKQVCVSALSLGVVVYHADTSLIIQVGKLYFKYGFRIVVNNKQISKTGHHLIFLGIDNITQILLCQWIISGI